MKEQIKDFLKKYSEHIVIFTLIILILVSRIYKFGEYPIAIGVDEAGAAYESYNIANYGVDRYLNTMPLYLVNFGGGQSVLYAYSNALLIKILGNDNIFISRLPALIFFLMAIFISYKLVSKMQNKKIAYLFAFFIIICPWEIMQSRYGLDCNLLRTNVYARFISIRNCKKELSIYISRNSYWDNIIYI